MTAIGMRPVFFAQQRHTRRLQLFRHCRIPELRSVKINHGDTHAMFYFAFAKFMQMRLPVRVFFEIFGDMLRQQECVRHRRNP